MRPPVEGKRYLIWATISLGWSDSRTQWWAASFFLDHNEYPAKPWWIAETGPGARIVSFGVPYRNMPKPPAHQGHP